MSVIGSVTPSPTHYIWIHRSTVSMLTPSHAMHLGSHIHSLQGEPPPQTLYFESLIHSPQGDPFSHTLYLVSHVHSLQGDPAPKTQYLGSHIHSVHGDLLPDPALRVRLPQSLQRPPSRPCTWDHMSTVHRVTPSLRPCTCCHVHRPQGDRTPQTLYLKSDVHHLQVKNIPDTETGSHMHSLHGDHSPHSSTWCTCPQSPC